MCVCAAWQNEGVSKFESGEEVGGWVIIEEHNLALTTGVGQVDKELIFSFFEANSTKNRRLASLYEFRGF